jgi:hypothetical protein
MGKLNSNIFWLLVFGLGLHSCNKLDIQWNLKKMPNVGNIEIALNNTTEFILKAECISIGHDKNAQMGFCWSQDLNPTLEDSVELVENTEIGFFQLKKFWSSTNIYFVRAFVKNEIGVVYSQNMQIIWPGENVLPIVQTLSINQVTFYSFSVNVNINNLGENPIFQRGIYIYESLGASTPIKTVLSNQVQNSFSVHTSEMTDGATYFIKAFAKTLAGEGLGNVLSVTLPKKYNIGQTGPAGGLIIYENPELFQSWNYIEVAPQDVSTNNFSWGPTNAATNATNVEIGTGLLNTNSVVSFFQNQSNYAAFVAKNWSFGGFTDWHLPSLKELVLIKQSLFDVGLGNFSNGQIYWTSSEDGVYSTNAWTVKMQQSNVNTILTYPKSEQFKLRAIRKF